MFINYSNNLKKNIRINIYWNNYLDKILSYFGRRQTIGIELYHNCIKAVELA